LIGCWQFLVVYRERQYLRKGEVYKEEQEYAYYVTSASANHYSASELIKAIRGHWDSIENGSHHRRDVSMGEDASGISKRPQAHMMASLRNLTLGLFERQKHVNNDSLPSWRRKMTPSRALRLLTSKA
jgi:predicted transposase YbfD/YdcC